MKVATIECPQCMLYNNQSIIQCLLLNEASPPPHFSIPLLLMLWCNQVLSGVNPTLFHPYIVMMLFSALDYCGSMYGWCMLLVNKFPLDVHTSLLPHFRSFLCVNMPSIQKRSIVAEGQLFLFRHTNSPLQLA